MGQLGAWAIALRDRLINVDNWKIVLRDWHVFADGLGQTVKTSGLALLLALAIGTIVGVMAVSPWRWLRPLTRIYVEFFQNTPLVVHAFFLYFGVPHLYRQLGLPPESAPSVFVIGVLVLGTYTGAYMSEVIRAGIQAVNRGQFEAAYSQGFTYVETMRLIILPQALRVMLPPMTNQMVNLIKNSAVLALIAGGDLMHRVDSWSSYHLLYKQAFVLTAVLYLILTLPLSSLARWLENRVGKAMGRQAT